MSIRFLSDSKGTTTDVVISIEEWNKMTDKYPDLNKMLPDIPEWQKKILDDRLLYIQTHPDSIKPIEALMEELEN